MVTLGIFLKNRKLTILIFLVLAVFFWVYGMHCLSTRIDMYNHRRTDTSGIHCATCSPINALGLLFGPSGRESYWGTAVNVIKHYPWFGCGYSAYVQTLRDLHVGHEEYPHNSLLHITAELGLWAGFVWVVFYCFMVGDQKCIT